MNTVMIIPYDDLKERMYITFGETFLNRWIAMIYASLVATLVVMPVDAMKTRV